MVSESILARLLGLSGHPLLGLYRVTRYWASIGSLLNILLDQVLTTKPKVIALLVRVQLFLLKSIAGPSATIRLLLGLPSLCHRTIDVTHNNLSLNNHSTKNQTLWLWLGPPGLRHKTIVQSTTIFPWKIVPLGIKLVTLALIPIVGSSTYH